MNIPGKTLPRSQTDVNPFEKLRNVNPTFVRARTREEKEMVGARGFEPPTPASRTRCATGLRYAPNFNRGQAT